MSFYDVLEILFDESSATEVLLLLLALSFVYFSVFRRRLGSVFDPLAYVLALSAASSTLLLLLGRHGVASTAKVLFVVGALTLFYLGFLLTDSSARNLRVAEPRVAARPRPVRVPTLAILFWANFFILAATYLLFGIPLFLESRLDQFVGSGGFGVLGRLTTGLEFGTLVLAFLALGKKSASRRWALAILVQFIVSAVLSGSKGALLAGLFAWYLSHLYRSRSWSEPVKLPRFMLAFLTLALVLPLFVIFVQDPDGGFDLAAVLRRLAVRFAAEGDVYAYFLGNDLIDSVARHDWFAPLRQILAAFRLVPAETSINPGFEIIREVLSVDAPTSGPNSRLPIFLLYFYGYGGILIAPFLGAALGWARNRLVRREPSSPVGFALAAAIYFHCCRLEVDPQLTVAGLFGLALAWPAFWVADVTGRVAAGRSSRDPGTSSSSLRPTRQ